MSEEQQDNDFGPQIIPPDEPTSIPPGMDTSYDNEWVRFLDKLSADKALGDIVDYINLVELTDKAKKKLIVYIRTLLDKEFATSRIVSNADLQKLMDHKNLIDCDLPLGLTRFDMTPEFQHVVNLLRIKFGIKVRRSMGGFERRILATQRSEVLNEERVTGMNDAQEKHGIANKVMSAFR